MNIHLVHDVGPALGARYLARHALGDARSGVFPDFLGSGEPSHRFCKKRDAEEIEAQVQLDSEEERKKMGAMW